MLFIIFGAAAIIWSVAVLRWSLQRGNALRRGLVIAAGLAAIAAAASLVSDARSLLRLHAATPSAVDIHIIRRGDWWQLSYARGGVTFTTANEMHVPADSVARISCHGAPIPWIVGSDIFAIGRTAISTGSPRVTEAHFVALHPLLCRSMPVIVERRADFDAWFAHQATPAHSSLADAVLFNSAGCAYCHRIRGAAESSSQVAPDLTHFASRHTIASVARIDRARLTAWIVDSRRMKPSSTMPRNAVAPEVLHRLVTYVGSLR